MNVQQMKRLLFAALTVVLADCSAGATGAPSLTTVPVTNPNYSKLQFVVGTANIYGTATGLNVVSTLRQPNGTSILLSTPSITGPFTLPATPGAPGSTINPYTGDVDAFATFATGPSALDISTKTIGATSQLVRPGTPVCDGTAPCAGGVAPNTSTFGQSGGVFGMGLAPLNSNINGVADSYSPYMQPFYDTTGTTFMPWGGPPAFDYDKTGMGTRDGENNLAAPVLGVGEGITVFERVGVGAGTYTLTAGIPNGTSVTPISTNATMKTTAVLPAAAPPTFTTDGKGGGSGAVTLPAGATEGYVQIVDYGPGITPPGTAANCQGAIGTAAYPVYYTIVVKASGTYALPDKIGPNLNTSGGTSNLQPSPSICTAAQNTAAGFSGGDVYTVQLIAFDYPMFEASYPKTLGVQAPPLAGANGQADISISAPAVATSGRSGMRVLHRRLR